ncbi:MAG: DUF72 domain-containing protein [Bacteroidota bacterium]
MEFGKVAKEELEFIDFTLPPDHALTKKVLAEAPKKEKLAVYVGCAKWGRKEWVGNLYPKGTKDSDFLKNYVKHFNSIELNGTFYQNHPAERVKSWYETAPEGFTFSPKFPQSISHYSRLKNADKATDEFFVNISELKEKLGHLLLQLPDNFAPKSQPELLAYLKSVHRTFPVAVELRNTNWFNDDELSRETFAAMHDMGVSSVITDAAGRRDCLHQVLPTPVAFIRFVANDMHPTDYLRMDLWIERIADWIDQGLKRVYFYVHNQNELYSPKLCEYFITELNSRCKLDLTLPFEKPVQGELF